MEAKICTKCKLEKPFSDFNKFKNGKFGLRAVCRHCHNESSKEYYENNKVSVTAKNIKWGKDPKNKEAIRFYFIKRTYGIDKKAWLELLKSQNNACAICSKTSDDLGFFYTDHDHETGKVRGLLCQNCNTVLGHAKDDVDILIKAIAYLKNN
jgi:protein-arginine kinase activator protein McsA